ncbi:MAG: FKBP-type peptidyl-prolyl cis-trans isomerase [Flavobacteriales bacterium]
MKKTAQYLTTLLLPAILMGCDGCTDKRKTAVTPQIQRDLVKEAKAVHENEMKAIEQYVADKQWPMQKTGSGLHYWIYENGSGDTTAQAEQYVAIAYTISLLDGTVCYTATSAKPKTFVVAHDNVETGLHEAVQLMRKGDKAKLILPSHLAFGFTGDSGKIPQNATVIYDLQLIEVW